MGGLRETKSSQKKCIRKKERKYYVKDMWDNIKTCLEQDMGWIHFETLNLTIEKICFIINIPFTPRPAKCFLSQPSSNKILYAFICS